MPPIGLPKSSKQRKVTSRKSTKQTTKQNSFVTTPMQQNRKKGSKERSKERRVQTAHDDLVNIMVSDKDLMLARQERSWSKKSEGSRSLSKEEVAPAIVNQARMRNKANLYFKTTDDDKEFRTEPSRERIH